MSSHWLEEERTSSIKRPTDFTECQLVSKAHWRRQKWEPWRLLVCIVRSLRRSAQSKGSLPSPLPFVASTVSEHKCMSLSTGTRAAQERGTVVNIGSLEPRSKLLWCRSESTKFSMSVLFRQLSLMWKKYPAIWQKLLDNQAVLLDREHLFDPIHVVQGQTQIPREETRARPMQILSEIGGPGQHQRST